MIRTAKQLEKHLNELNKNMNIKVSKVTSGGRVTGYSTMYKLSVGTDRFYIADFTMKGLIKTVMSEDVLQLNSRYGTDEYVIIFTK